MKLLKKLGLDLGSDWADPNAAGQVRACARSAREAAECPAPLARALECKKCARVHAGALPLPSTGVAARHGCARLCNAGTRPGHAAQETPTAEADAPGQLAGSAARARSDVRGGQVSWIHVMSEYDVGSETLSKQAFPYFGYGRLLGGRFKHGMHLVRDTLKSITSIACTDGLSFFVPKFNEFVSRHIEFPKLPSQKQTSFSGPGRVRLGMLYYVRWHQVRRRPWSASSAMCRGLEERWLRTSDRCVWWMGWMDEHSQDECDG